MHLDHTERAFAKGSPMCPVTAAHSGQPPGMVLSKEMQHFQKAEGTPCIPTAQTQPDTQV